MIHIAPTLITRTRGLHDEDHDDGVTMVMIKCLDFEMKKEKNRKLKAKVKFDRSFLVW